MFKCIPLTDFKPDNDLYLSLVAIKYNSEILKKE